MKHGNFMDRSTSAPMIDALFIQGQILLQQYLVRYSLTTFLSDWSKGNGLFQMSVHFFE